MVHDILDNNLESLETTTRKWLPDDFLAESSKIDEHINKAKMFTRRIASARKHVDDRRSTFMLTGIDTPLTPTDTQASMHGRLDIDCYDSDSDDGRPDDRGYSGRLAVDSDDDMCGVDDCVLEKTIGDMRSMTSRYVKVDMGHVGS